MEDIWYTLVRVNFNRDDLPIIGKGTIYKPWTDIEGVKIRVGNRRGWYYFQGLQLGNVTRGESGMTNYLL